MSKIPRLRHVVAAAALAATTIGITPLTGASRVEAAPPGAARVTLIGDSTMAAMRWYAVGGDINKVISNSYDLLFDAESCRRLVATSCLGRIDPNTGERTRPVSLLPLIQSTHKGKLGEVLVIMTGYDDYSVEQPIDLIMAEALKQGVQRVMWLTYRTSTTYGYGPYYEAHNRKLHEAQAEWPALDLLDWNGYTRSLSKSTQDAWFTPDDIHMTRTGAFGLSNYIKNQLDQRKVERCLPARALTGTPISVGTPAAGSTPAGGFSPVASTRVLDTRNVNLGGANGMIGAGRAATVNLAGKVPARATSAVFSVTVQRPCDNGFVTLFDCGTLGAVSTLNYVTNRTTTNSVVSKLGADQQVCVYSSAASEVVVDLLGSFGAGGDPFTPMTSRLWASTRGSGVASVPQAAFNNGQQVDIAVAGRAGVPSDATGVAITAGVFSTGAGGNLTFYPGPCGTPPANVTIATHPGRGSSTDSFVPLGSNGGLCARVGGGSPQHFNLVVKGWFGPSGTMLFSATTPARHLNTIADGAPLAAGGTARVTTSDLRVFNLAAVQPVANGGASVASCGASPIGTQVFAYRREAVAGSALVAPGTSSQVCFTTNVTQHVVVDSFGVFVSQP